MPKAPVAPARPKKNTPAKLPTLREALGVKGDLRIGRVTRNRWTGDAKFVVEEGELMEEGFIFGRQVIELGLTGETLTRFYKLSSDDKACLKAQDDFLLAEFKEMLDKPVATQK